MAEITIKIPQEIVDKLRALNENPTDEMISNFAMAALHEWADWLSGDFRPMSISELETERIFKIYETVITNQYPSVDRLGNLLQMPMGRARYILQSLAYRRRRFLIKRQLVEVSELLKKSTRQQNGTYLIVVDRGCQSIIDLAFKDLFARKKIASTVTCVVTLEGIEYEMGENHHAMLSEELKRQLDALNKATV